jgi:hypothetical protein
MIHCKEELVNEKTNSLGKILSDYVEEMDKLSETDEFTIDNIEKLWAGADERASEVFREISSEIVEKMDERKIIKAKKKSIKAKG